MEITLLILVAGILGISIFNYLKVNDLEIRTERTFMEIQKVINRMEEEEIDYETREINPRIKDITERARNVIEGIWKNWN